VKFHFKNASIIFSVSCLFVVVVTTTQCKRDATLTQTNQVRDVVSATELVLKTGEHVQLVGVKIPSDIAAKARTRVEQVALTRPVIIEPAGPGSALSVVYVWGFSDLQRTKWFPVERRGFTNVKVGFMDVRKGMAINLNALLVREGYARVDAAAPGQIPADFLELQKVAENEKIGFWSKAK
jgi:Staphylococcal nuclease homologue